MSVELRLDTLLIDRRCIEFTGSRLRRQVARGLGDLRPGAVVERDHKGQTAVVLQSLHCAL